MCFSCKLIDAEDRKGPSYLRVACLCGRPRGHSSLAEQEISITAWCLRSSKPEETAHCP